MKLEPIWKPVTTLKEIPYNGSFLANFDSSLNIQTTFKHGNTLYGYEAQNLPVEYCKLPEDNEFFARLVSETFSVTGFVLGTTWEGYETILPIREDIDVFYQLETFIAILTKNLNANNLTGTGDFQKELGAIVAIATTTTVAIQGHLFTNVSESIEFIGELTDEQKETLSSLL
jgi:hypothetical protein